MKINKSFVAGFVLLLAVFFITTQALASFTFSANTISGTTNSNIDVGAGNTLLMQTINNGPVTIGTGLVTIGGNLTITGLASGGTQCLHVSSTGVVSGTGSDCGSGGSTTANALNSATTVVSVSAATAPSAGQVLTATNSTHAIWQTPAGASGTIPVSASINDGASSCTTTGGTGTNSCTASGSGAVITHNLNTSQPVIVCYDGSGNMLGSTGSTTSVQSIVATSANVATLTFSGPTTAVCMISAGTMGPQGNAGATGATGPQGPAGSGSGDVLGPVTNSTGFIPTWNGANSKTLANGIDPATLMNLSTPVTLSQLPTATKVRTCTLIVGDPGAASTVLADDNDSPVACGNSYGADWTIQTVSCYADAGSPTVTPILTGGSATSILAGPLTCGTGAWAAGTLQVATPVVHSFSGAGATCSTTPCTIDDNITTAGGVAKYLIIKISGTL
jgi:hypothetical protein